MASIFQERVESKPSLSHRFRYHRNHHHQNDLLVSLRRIRRIPSFIRGISSKILYLELKYFLYMVYTNIFGEKYTKR
ncbi:hypothetical protein Leryth_002591 [Lithospermum erythrorhizon]|nr:hypothetical protein Leryth_002591 [Lithospermum erythrorhizon]